ncbi:MAG: hypothetical protein LBC88_04415 [Spirochaetaceae bacterium]|nr:hypothetical protein [Spirochaetaceae bacterium]
MAYPARTGGADSPARVVHARGITGTKQPRAGFTEGRLQYFRVREQADV